MTQAQGNTLNSETPPVQGEGQAAQTATQKSSGSVGVGAPQTVPGCTAPEGGPSPNFVQENHTIWDQSYLAKAMLQMKDAEFVKLRFSDSCYRPYE